MALSPEEQRRYRDYLFGPGGPHPMTFNYPGDPAPYEPGYTPTGIPASTNDLVGADNGLFAPGLVRGDPGSEDAVTRWNIAHLLMAPKNDAAVTSPVAPTAPTSSADPAAVDAARRREQIAWALLAQTPGGMQGDGSYSLAAPTAPDAATPTATPAADTSTPSTPSTTTTAPPAETTTDISVQAAPKGEPTAEQDAHDLAEANQQAVQKGYMSPEGVPTEDTTTTSVTATPAAPTTATPAAAAPDAATPSVAAPPSAGLTTGTATVGDPGAPAPGPPGFGNATVAQGDPTNLGMPGTASNAVAPSNALGQISGFGTGHVGTPSNAAVPGLTGQTDAVTQAATPMAPIGPPAPPAPPTAPAPVGLDQATVNSIAANAAMHAAVQLGYVNTNLAAVPDKGVPTDLALAMNPVTVMADPTTVAPSTVSVADSPNTTASIGFADAGPLGGFGFGSGGYAPGIAGVAGPDGGFSDGTTGSDGSGGFGGVGQGVGIGGLGSAGGVSSGADSGGYGPGPAGTPGVSIGAPGQGVDGFGAGATAVGNVGTTGNLGGGYGISGPADAAGLAAAAAAAAAASAE